MCMKGKNMTIIKKITFFFGLIGLWGLESLECFWLVQADKDWLRRFDTGVFSTDLKYFSCMESSLPPPLPSMLPFLTTFVCFGVDIKLPDRTNETMGESEHHSDKTKQQNSQNYIHIQSANGHRKYVYKDHKVNQRMGRVKNTLLA